MKRHFYHSLVNVDSIVLALNELDMTDAERLHILSLVESSLHHAVLDSILSHLSEEDKQIFLSQLESDDHEKIWEFLKERIETVEDMVTLTAEQLKQELHEDIASSQQEKE